MKRITTVCDYCNKTLSDSDGFSIFVPENQKSTGIIGAAAGIYSMSFTIQTAASSKAFKELAFCNLKCFDEFIASNFHCAPVAE